MSELRIRTEVPPSAQFVDDWRPRSAQAPPDDGDDTPFMPLILALEAELAGRFGLQVSAHPGRSLPPGAPDVALELGALLATVRLGGDPTRPVTLMTGVTTQRHARQLADHLQAKAQALWPPGSRRAALIIDVLVTLSPGNTVVGSVRLPAPPVPQPVLPAQPLGAAALDLPLRLPVRLASEMLPLQRLLPLRPGLVIAFNTCPEMPVMLGDHQIGLASLVPLPDGRQQASIISIDLKPNGERA
jgi:flagellar motor switch/type III secretory pathway protein FliN